jgi:peptidoglycan/LPS O-acetylase OafA/YrhL
MAINHSTVVNALLVANLTAIFLVLAYKANIAKALELNLPFESSLLSPLFLVLILVSVRCDNGFTTFVSRPFFLKLGEASYAIYILQKPLRSLYQAYLYPAINTSLHIHLSRDIHFVMYFFLLVYVSLWITARIEKPVKDFLRKQIA